ncbi:hypothetical protein ONZ45_g12542 [Pleurotus djamor]|nr:hypothetical protein ONZ45_g12542 [Pleurotus djamor]
MLPELEVSAVITAVTSPRGIPPVVQDYQSRNSAHGGPQAQAKLLAPTLIWLGSSAFADLFVTGGISYILVCFAPKRGFAPFSFLLIDATYLKVTLETGLLTSTCILLEIVLFLLQQTGIIGGFRGINYDDSAYYMIPDLILSKLYANMLLATLNARAQWRVTSGLASASIEIRREEIEAYAHAVVDPLSSIYGIPTKPTAYIRSKQDSDRGHLVECAPVQKPLVDPSLSRLFTHVFPLMKNTITSTVTKPRTISGLPPEILSLIFILLSDNSKYTDNLRACQICRSWLPSAQAALYHSVTLSTTNLQAFTRTINETPSFVSLIRHLNFNPIAGASNTVYIPQILDAFSSASTTVALSSLQLHADTLDKPSYHTQIVKSFSSLRSLTIDTNIFPTFHAMKVFIASLPNLRVLEVTDEVGGDFNEDWYGDHDDESESQTAPLGFPSTLKEVTSNLPCAQTLDALLNWIACSPEASLSVQRFTIIITESLDGVSLTPSLKAFGTALKSLTMDYQWPSDLPEVTLIANTSLQSLTLRLDLFDEHDGLIKPHLSHILKTLSSSSLQKINISIRLYSPPARFDRVLDMEILDKSTEGADVCISVNLPGWGRERRVEMEEWIVERMPRHVAKGRLEYGVS